MATSKSTKVTYWIATGIIFIMEGLLPALTGHSKMAKDGILALGYPEYFITLLTVFKVLGALSIMLPMISPRIKEWAYAGLTFSLISAFVSNVAVYGPVGLSFFPVVIMAILMVSYVTYHKIRNGALSPSAV